MKNKRILSLVLAFAMLLGTFSFAFADEANIPEEIQWLIDEGYVLGDDGGYRLGDNITRAEVAVIVAKALGLEDAAKAAQPVKGQFKDVPAGRWDNGFINVLAGKGILNGYPDGTFKANNKISNAEVVTIMVMMIDGKVPEGGKYPFNMIARATELGLFNGTNIADYSKDATRQDTFMLIYNALMNLEIGKYSVIKGIVLENNRVEALGKDEVVVEVIKEVQRANYADASRYEKGDQIRLTVPADVADVEDLLGKVADFTITAGNKVVKAPKVDETYTYVNGEFEVTKSKFGRYTVELPERYKDNDERIFRTYHNDKSYNYEQFAKEFEAVDYARATIKNGKVLFIDAYTFDDVAPVKEVKEGVAHVYNDERNGAIKEISIPANAIAVKGEEFLRDADVKELDVVHLYKNGKGMLVKKDAKVEGTFKKVSFDRKFEDVKVVVDDKEYQVLDAKYMKPVYSLDLKEFHTLYTNDADRQLREFKDEEVTVLTDLNGNLQYITTEVDLGEFVALLSDVLSRDVRVVKADNSKGEYRATFDSILEKAESTKQQNLNNFYRGELVYMSVEGENIDILKGIKDYNYEGKKAEIIERQNYIKIDDKDEYKLLDRTNVFLRTENELRATTIADIVKNYKEAGLKAYVVSDEEFNKTVKFARGLNTGKPDVAHTVVFTDAEAKVSYNYKNAEILRIYTSGRDYEVRVEFANGERETYSVVRGSKAYDNIKDDVVKESDIVKIELTKDEEPKLTDIVKVIDKDAPVFEVTDVKSYSGYRLLKIKDANNEKIDYFLYNDADVFGYVEEGSKVSFKLAREGKEDIDVMVVRPRNAKVNGVHGETTAPDEEVTGVVTYIDASGKAITEDVVLASTDTEAINVEYKNDTKELVKFDANKVKVYVEDAEGNEVMKAENAAIELNPGVTKKLFATDLSLAIDANKTDTNKLHPGKAYTVKLLIDGKLQDETVKIYVKDNDVSVKKVVVEGVEVTTAPYDVQLPLGVKAEDVTVKEENITLTSKTAKVIELKQATDKKSWTFKVEAEDGTKSTADITITLNETKVNTVTVSIVDKNTVKVEVKDNQSTPAPVKGLKAADFIVTVTEGTVAEGMDVESIVESNTEAGIYQIKLTKDLVSGNKVTVEVADITGEVTAQ